eukprot:CAMPEP_0181082744 /NCGR_PEP_ID=MMETSP1071-20121207/3785_1 /TAXON_ID=35127 /ORGANISM="Thalassiosira sp., Strain NH16" /LENGTH=111 /DNA_ID=CAMNT_0023164351 /DNA_START=46 /DNA_END=379 /DNA_ORIENTATION=+
MKVDPSLEAAGHQCGIDVEALYKKYSNPSSASASAHEIDNLRPASSVNPDMKCIRICKQCHGYGLVKETYNFQVKEVNCGECEGEGIVGIENKENYAPGDIESCVDTGRDA